MVVDSDVEDSVEAGAMRRYAAHPSFFALSFRSLLEACLFLADAVPDARADCHIAMSRKLYVCCTHGTHKRLSAHTYTYGVA